MPHDTANLPIGPGLDSPGAQFVDDNYIRAERRIERLGDVVSRLSEYPVIITVNSYNDEQDAPRQDIIVSIKGLPMTDASGELCEALRDLTSSIEELHRVENERLAKKAEAARRIA